jgi:hypothetical protein
MAEDRSTNLPLSQQRCRLADGGGRPDGLGPNVVRVPRNSGGGAVDTPPGGCAGQPRPGAFRTRWRGLRATRWFTPVSPGPSRHPNGPTSSGRGTETQVAHRTPGGTDWPLQRLNCARAGRLDFPARKRGHIRARVTRGTTEKRRQVAFGSLLAFAVRTETDLDPAVVGRPSAPHLGARARDQRRHTRRFVAGDAADVDPAAGGVVHGVRRHDALPGREPAGPADTTVGADRRDPPASFTRTPDPSAVRTWVGPTRVQRIACVVGSTAISRPD